MQEQKWKTTHIFYILAAIHFPWLIIGFLQAVLENSDFQWVEIFNQVYYLFFEDLFDVSITCGLVFWMVRKKYSATLEDIGLSSNALFQNMVVGGIVGVALWYLTNYMNEGARYLFDRNYVHPLLQKVLDTKNILELILLFIMVTFFAVLSEEIFLRGFVYNIFRKNFDRIKATILASSLFALFHVVPDFWLAAFAASICLIALYEYTGTLVASMSAHFIVNSLSFLEVCCRQNTV